MLKHLENKINALQKFSFEDEVVKIVTDNKDKLSDLQAMQLSQGKRSDGKDINPQYAPFTVAYKKQFGRGLGAVTDRVTFFQTGELYSKLYAAVEGKKFRIKADSFKFDKMVKRSGIDVVGLNEESISEFRDEIVMPGVLEAYIKKTHL